jgi:hypothetical protein
MGGRRGGQRRGTATRQWRVRRPHPTADTAPNFARQLLLDIGPGLPAAAGSRKLLKLLAVLRRAHRHGFTKGCQRGNQKPLRAKLGAETDGCQLQRHVWSVFERVRKG